MNIGRFSVHRPVFTIMATLIVMLLGMVSLTRLPVDLMPDISFPTLSVQTSYENASAEEIEELVTRPLEEALSAVPGVEEVTSTSAEGQSSLRVSFAWGTDLDAAANDIRDRLDRVAGRLPADADRPTLRKFDLAAFPVLILGASSDLDPLQARRIIEDQVKYRIERVAGVASLDIWGGVEREVRVDLDLNRIRAHGVPLNQIIDEVRAGNLDLPAGTLRQGHLDLRVRVPGSYASLDELRDTVILEREDNPILLRDVAEVNDGIEKVTRIVRVNGKPGIRLSVNKQSGTNTVQVAQAALREIERINEDIPQLQIFPIIDSSEYIQESIENVSAAALYGGALAVLVLLLFLRDLRSTVVIAASIPVSIIATFVMIYFGGFTLNLMTLGGLALGIGMLVDNSIVVLENITRLRAEGMAPKEAAEHGAAEVTSAIVASTLTTMVVFLPLIFMRGMSGVMFKQLSMVVAFALLCSLATAMTLVPMLAARLTGHATDDHSGAGLGNRIFRWSAGLFEQTELGYKALIHWSLNWKPVVLLLALLLLAGSGSLVVFGLIGSELMPAADEGEVRVYGEMETGTALDVLDRQFKQMAAVIRAETPEIENMVASMGSGGWRARGGHTGRFRISLVPQSQRTRSSEEVADDLRTQLAGIPGVQIRTRAGQGLFIMRRIAGGDGDRLNIEIRGHDFDTGAALASQIKQVVEGVAGVTDARISRDPGSPERRLLIDRRKAADLKLTVRDIAEMLEIVLGGVSAGNFRDDGDEYTIRVRAPQAERLPLDELLDLTITNREGTPVVMRNLVTVQPATGPVEIERRNQERTVTVRAEIAERDMGSVVEDIRDELRGVAVPQGFDIVFGGDYEEQQEAFRELMISLALAIVLVYMVMACQFESLRDPFVVMFSVPLAAIGVLVMLFLSGTTFNIQSFIGCIMLAGIVVNNAILLVDHTNLLRRRDGLPLREAIEEAGRRRLRPILMTALTTILGLVPLALGLGEGGEAQAPMARAVIGGLLSATLITLVIVPVIYALFERKHTGHAMELPLEGDQ